MKNSNIKLHFNIMNIFKYLVFVLSFLIVYIFASNSPIRAIDIESTNSTWYIDFDSYASNCGVSSFHLMVSNSKENAKKNGYLWVSAANGSRKKYSHITIRVYKYTENDYAPAIEVTRINKSTNSGIVEKYSFTDLFNFNLLVGEDLYDYGTKMSFHENFNRNDFYIYASVENGCTGLFSHQTNAISPVNIVMKKIQYTMNSNLTDATICVYKGSSSCTNTSIKETNWSKSHKVTVTYNNITNATYCIGSAHPDEGYECGGNRADGRWQKFTSGTQIEVLNGYLYLNFDSSSFSVGEKGKKILFRSDSVPPTITYDYPTSSIMDWAKSHTVSGVEVRDSASGVKSRYYCWSTSLAECKGNNWQSFTENDSSIVGSGYTGKYYLLIKAEDNAGNVTQVVVTTQRITETRTETKTIEKRYFTSSKKQELEKSGYVCYVSDSTTSGTCKKNVTESVTVVTQEKEDVLFYFDNEKPTLNIKIGSSKDLDKGLISNKWTNETDFYAELDDEHSGIESAMLYWVLGTSKPSNWRNSNTINLKPEENRWFNWVNYIADIEEGLYIKIELKDKAGNTLTKNAPLYIDNVAPNITSVELKSSEVKYCDETISSRICLNLEDSLEYTVTIKEASLEYSAAEIKPFITNMDMEIDGVNYKYTSGVLKASVINGIYITPKSTISKTINGIQCIEYTFHFLTAGEKIVYTYEIKTNSNSIKVISNATPLQANKYKDYVNGAINLQTLLPKTQQEISSSTLEDRGDKIGDRCYIASDIKMLETWKGHLKINFVIKCEYDIKITTNGTYISEANTLTFESIDRVENIGTLNFYRNGEPIYIFDSNGVTLKDGDSEILGTVKANGFFPSKSNTTKTNLVTYEIEELVNIEVEDIIVVNNEEAKDMEVSVDEEEQKLMDDDFTQFGDNDAEILYVETTCLEKELKRALLTQINKKKINIQRLV